MNDLSLDGPLWDFALRVYTQPGVGEACIDLQDRFELDVNLLLFAAWMGAEQGTVLSEDDLRQAHGTVRAWHQEVVRPLRQVRRRMKSGPPPAPSTATKALREKLKALEIEAERIELAALAAWPGQSRLACGPGSPESGRRNLALVVRLFSGSELDADAEERIGRIVAATGGLARPAGADAGGA